MEFEHILYEVEGPVATITFNRPERLNAFSFPMRDEIDKAYDLAETDPEVRAIIVTGSGRAFSSGMDQGGQNARWHPEGNDIGAFLKGRGAGRNQDPQNLRTWRLSKPVIAAVHGWCMGAGFFLALAADITIAADDAVFGQPEVRHVSGVSFLFAALCGWKVAHRYGLTGDHFDAQEALRIGAINEVVPRDELLPRARQLAERIAMVPEASVRLNKAVTTMGLMASGLYAGMMMNGPLGTLTQGSYGPERDRLHNIREEGGVRAFLDARDGPFLPEPFGPKAKPRVKESVNGG